MFKKVYRHLEGEGFDVYPIGIKPNYNNKIIILKDCEPTRIAGTAFNNCLCYLYCHIPLGDYIEALDYKEKIKEAMDKLDNFDKLDDGSQIMVDESTETYFFVLQYNNKRVRRIK